MRLFELVDSDVEVLGLIKPILLRAKAEGATEISMAQLLNDMDSADNISAEMMIDILNRHRQDLKNIVSTANIDSVVLNKGPAKTMTSKFDQQSNKMKNTALKQAMDQLK
jgi:hypothetical protein